MSDTTVGSLPVHDVVDIKANMRGDRCVLSTLTDIIVCAVPLIGPNDIIKRARFAKVQALAVGANACVFFVRDELCTMDLYTGRVERYMRCPPGSNNSVGMLLMPQHNIVLGVTNRLIRSYSPKWYNGATNRVDSVSVGQTTPTSTSLIASAVCSPSMLLLLSRTSELYICSFDTHVSGLKWYNVGTGRPDHGEELKNDALATALERGPALTHADWAKINIDGLSLTHFVQAGSFYFRPAMDAAPRLDIMDKKFVVNTYALSEHFYAYESRDEIVVCNLQGQERSRHTISSLPLRELQVSRRGDIAFNDAEGNTVVQPIDSVQRMVESSLSHIILADYMMIGRGVGDVRSLFYRNWHAEVRARILSAGQ